VAEAENLTQRNDWFASTHWSVVLLAGQSGSPDGRAALEQLCRSYWKPLFAYARGLGQTEEDAKDLTQAFFEHFLHKGYIRAADPQRGRFRGFLRTSFKHFINADWVRAKAEKRGGKANLISWDEMHGLEGLCADVSSTETPDHAYDRMWAVQLFSRAMERLREEFIEAGRANQYEALRPFLESSGDPAAHEEAACKLKSTVNAVVVAIHRLRQRLRQVIRDEIAHTVTRPEEIEEELRYLRELLNEPGR
jgi:DNA-directed RNA polymerase specialized sigma24 family protein